MLVVKSREMDQTKRHTTIASAKVATAGGPPQVPVNPFWGVGPITDMIVDEIDAAKTREKFEVWLGQSYRKTSATGQDLGGFSSYELSRSMHRGYPGDAILRDLAHHIHRYFGFPVYNRLAVGVGGGHAGFTAVALHFINSRDPEQGIFIDTPAPENNPGGFFRQLWGTQLIEMMSTAPGGNIARLKFSETDGTVPSPDELERIGVKLFFGVGHETSGATTYSTEDVANLLDWIDRDPARHHAIIDATSLLGAMPWDPELIGEFTKKCNFFMPFQKAIGGEPGYYAISLTPAARTFIDITQTNPSFAIPRQYRLAVPIDPALPLSSRKTTERGPIYDPQTDEMVGGIINTFSPLAFAQTTFALLRMEHEIGTVETLNARSVKNRDIVTRWINAEPLFELSVGDDERRGAAVTLISVKDPDIADEFVKDQIVAASKGLLSYEGLAGLDGAFEPGMNAARYINAFPGTPGDYRAWIGGVRPESDILALLNCMKYAYLRAKIAVLATTK